jgi:mRNA interferase HigB
VENGLEPLDRASHCWENAIVTVVGEHKVTKFAKKHAASRRSLARFVELAQAAEWKHFTELKETFPAAGYVSGIVIFDIGGNKYRLTATVNYELQTLLIEEVLTHEQYNEREM